jgi:hypothetical protein
MLQHFQDFDHVCELSTRAFGALFCLQRFVEVHVFLRTGTTVAFKNFRGCFADVRLVEACLQSAILMLDWGAFLVRHASLSQEVPFF